MRKAAALLLLLLFPLQAMAEMPCPQEKAIYDGVDGYRIGFRPVGSDAAMTSHHFDTVASGQTLTGYMMESEPPLRSIAHVEKDCPEGDVTGDDIAACTVYEGYVYAIADDGGAGNLPRSDAPAARHLLFAGLGPALAASPIAEKLKLPAPSADMFTFKECTP